MKNFLKYVLIVTVLVVAVTAPSPSEAAFRRENINQCVQSLSKDNTTGGLRAKFSSYAKEIVRTRGLRFLLKNAPANVDTQTKLGGLFVYAPPTKGIKFGSIYSLLVDLLPRAISFAALQGYSYKFTPFQFASQWLLDKPVGAVSEKVFRVRRRQFSNVVKFPLTAIALATAFELLVEDSFDRAMTTELTALAYEHQTELYKIIETDFRYRQIYEGLNEGALTKEQALKAAYTLKSIFNLYYQTIGEIETNFPKEALQLMQVEFSGHPLFSVADDFVTKSGTAKPELVYSLTHALYYNYAFLDELMAKDSIKDELVNQTLDYSLWDRFSSDPFVSLLFEAYNRGALNAAELKYLLQQDFYYQYKFQLAALAGSQLTGPNSEPLGLDRLREAILSDLLKARG